MIAVQTQSTFSVSVSRADVQQFNASWPCSHIPARLITFTFDKRSGDLIDIIGTSADGPEMVALSEDAQRYGEATLGITTPHFDMPNEHDYPAFEKNRY